MSNDAVVDKGKAQKVKSGTVVLVCKKGCRNEFQERMYGAGKRVHNRMGKSVPGNAQARCTSCENVREA